MFATTRSARALALRGEFFRPCQKHGREDSILTANAANPTTALLPFRGAQAAFISNSSNKSAAAMETPGLVKGNPGTPPPMKSVTGKNHREVPLPSQEGKQGVMQYAL